MMMAGSVRSEKSSDRQGAGKTHTFQREQIYMAPWGRRCFVLGELQRQKVEVRMSSLSVVYYAMRWLSILFSVAPRAVHLEIE